MKIKQVLTKGLEVKLKIARENYNIENHTMSRDRNVIFEEFNLFEYNSRNVFEREFL